MKKLFVCLFVVALSLPSVAYETQTFNTECSRASRNLPSFRSLKCLDDGFAGYTAKPSSISSCINARKRFTPDFRNHDNAQASKNSSWSQINLGPLFRDFQGKWYGQKGNFGQKTSLADEMSLKESPTWFNSGLIAHYSTFSGGFSGTIDIPDSPNIGSAVPAPGALLLAGIGTLFVGFLRRRNRE